MLNSCVYGSVYKKVAPEKRATLLAGSTLSNVHMRKTVSPLCSSQELTTGLAHALIVSFCPN